MSRILNQTGRVVVAQATLARTPWERTRGLLGHPVPPNGHGLLLVPCRSIHMFFMRYPIDAAFLDRELRVLKVVFNLQPWQLALAPRHTHCVLETAAGTLQTLQVGESLRIEGPDP